MKLIFVHLLSKGYFSRFRSQWHSRCAFLYQSYDSAVFIPKNEDEDVRRELGIGARARSWFPVADCTMQKVITIDVWVPSRWENDTAICARRSWPQRYALLSGAFFVFHLLRSPLLKEFEIYAKIDADVCMLKPLPIAPVLDVFGSRETLVLHTAIHPSSDCERDVLAQLRQYRQARGVRAPMDAWCSAPQLSEIFYGNFVFYNASFMTSRAALLLTSYFYEERGDGFFRNRWGDQAVPPALLCGTAPSVGSPALSADPRVHDGYAMRAYFRHGRYARCGRHLDEHKPVVGDVRVTESALDYARRHLTNEGLLQQSKRLSLL